MVPGVELKPPKSSTPISPLPDFCRPQAVLLVLIVGVLLALLITLAAAEPFAEFFPRLGTASLMITLVSLAACAVLCAAGNKLRRLHPAWIWVLVVLLFQALSLTISWLAVTLYGVDDPLPWLLRNQLVAAIAGLILVRYLALYRNWRLQVRAETQSRLNALQARIRPHFLFNTLNTIASLLRSRPDAAEQAVLDLSDLLRSGLQQREQHTLADEIEILHGYLRIEELRLGDRLTVAWDLADDLPLQSALPALLIQPLVENAVVHGIARRAEGGVLRISAHCPKRQRVVFTISNPIAAEPPRADEESRRAGMALDNIHQRLELAFEEGAKLRVRNEDGQFQAELTLPIG